MNKKCERPYLALAKWLFKGQLSTQYYERLLHSPKKEKVIAEMKRNTKNFQSSQFELIKSPVIAEFLGGSVK